MIEYFFKKGVFKGGGQKFYHTSDFEQKIMKRVKLGAAGRPSIINWMILTNSSKKKSFDNATF